MIGSHSARVTGRPLVPTTRRRIRWVPLAAMVCVLALSAIATTAAQADNSVPFQHVLFEGQSAGHCPGSTDTYCLENNGTTFKARLTMQFMGSQGNQSQTLLTVANDTSESSAIEAWIGQLSGPFVRLSGPDAQADAERNLFCIGLELNTRAFVRLPFVGCGAMIDNGSEKQYVYTVQGTQPAFTSLDLSFDFLPLSICDFPPPGAALDARTADACTPPSNTRITQAKIKGNTASFRFSARLANRFQCELFRNRRIMFSHSCQSPKPYANPLPPGRYTFRVVGVNGAGFDIKPAVKKFTVS